jgi:hypothetical protein
MRIDAEEDMRLNDVIKENGKEWKRTWIKRKR